MQHTPPPSDLRITAGALAPDGGSIWLEGMTGDATSIRIFLDWSHYAQELNVTRLDVDDQSMTKGGEDEAAWIAAIASATVTGNETLAFFRDNLVEKLRSFVHTGEPRAL